MRAIRSISARRSVRALATAGLVVLASLGASTAPAAATPAVSVTVRDITASSASICATGIRPAVITEFAIYDGDDNRLAGSTKNCNTVSGLKPSTRYIFVFKSGRPGEESSMVPEGEVFFTTQAVAFGGVVAKTITSTSVEICKTYVNVAAERMVVYRTSFSLPRVKVAESTGQCATVSGLDPSRRYSFSVEVATVGSPDSALYPIGSVDVTTLDASGQPAGVTISLVEPRAAILCAPQVPTGTERRYAIYDGDNKIGAGPSVCVLTRELSPETTYTLDFRSGPADAPDEALASDGKVTFTTPAVPTVPQVTAEQIGKTSAVICGVPKAEQVLLRWAVFDGTVKLNHAFIECVLVTSLTPGKEYTLTLKQTSSGAPDTQFVKEGDVTFRTLADPSTNQPVDFTYDLAGAAALKTLTTGSLPLSGSIKAQLNVATGAFTGELALAPTTGKLVALGFLPVVAQVNLVPTEKVAGTLAAGKLKATAKVRIKLPSVKALGIELAGGANCQAKQISSIALASTQPTFLPLSGGPLAGSFGISDLSGCGFLTGIVSPLTKGEGNTIALNLTPRPTA